MVCSTLSRLDKDLASQNSEQISGAVVLSTPCTAQPLQFLSDSRFIAARIDRGILYCRHAALQYVSEGTANTCGLRKSIISKQSSPDREHTVTLANSLRIESIV